MVEPDPHPAVASEGRPDIVVIYMDDFSPLAPWLWSRPHRTPALARFVNDGVTFRHASGQTPMCCPGRANLLTGQFGHRSGVTRNDIRAFRPEDSIAPRLQAAGYETAFVGKYLNSLRGYARTRARMASHARGWDTFSVIWENQGAFYDYRYYRRSGTSHYGRAPGDHSSRVAAREARRAIRTTPADKPLFMVVSLYDGHRPYVPMRRFVKHRKCRGVRSWRGPAYDEADVSDKPRYIRRLPRIRERSFSLRQHCSAAMTVNDVAYSVRRALAAAGRLDDTLLVLTADNGFLMGDHRLRSKTHAYATPVPLYMLWPARWGKRGRTIREPVSNIDLPVTFCALAGCTLPKADGMSLLPLLDGSAADLERTFLYEEMLHAAADYDGRSKGRPGWYGLRTTGRYGRTRWADTQWEGRRWVYTEYERGKRLRGERELYDLTTDPHQLRNLAGKPRYAAVQADLRTLLHDEVVGPDDVRFLEPLPR